MGHGPAPRNQFSFSRLKTFEQCPLRYRYRYLKGLPEGFRSVESFVGTVVHEVLEWLYATRRDSADPTPAHSRDELATRWDERWTGDVAVVRAGRDVDVYRREAEEMLLRYVTGAFRRDRSSTVALEQRFTVPLRGRFRFTGIADRVGRTPKGRLFVVDYKTSRSLGNSGDYSEGLQAPLYAVCALRHHRSDDALSGYHYLRHEETRWRRIDRDGCDPLLARAAALVERADAATEFPARPGPLCAWCGYNAICDAARVPQELSGGRLLAIRRAPERPLPMSPAPERG